MVRENDHRISIFHLIARADRDEIGLTEELRIVVYPMTIIVWWLSCREVSGRDCSIYMAQSYFFFVIKSISYNVMAVVCRNISDRD